MGYSGRDRMVVGFTITYVISDYQHYCCEFESRSWRGVFDTLLCDIVTPAFSTNKTDRHDMTEILVKVALYTITP